MHRLQCFHVRARQARDTGTRAPRSTALLSGGVVVLLRGVEPVAHPRERVVGRVDPPSACECRSMARRARTRARGPPAGRGPAWWVGRWWRAVEDAGHGLVGDVRRGGDVVDGRWSRHCWLLARDRVRAPPVDDATVPAARPVDQEPASLLRLFTRCPGRGRAEVCEISDRCRGCRRGGRGRPGWRRSCLGSRPACRAGGTSSRSSRARRRWRRPTRATSSCR